MEYLLSTYEECTATRKKQFPHISSSLIWSFLSSFHDTQNRNRLCLYWVDIAYNVSPKVKNNNKKHLSKNFKYFTMYKKKYPKQARFVSDSFQKGSVLPFNL